MTTEELKKTHILDEETWKIYQLAHKVALAVIFNLPQDEEVVKELRTKSEELIESYASKSA